MMIRRAFTLLELLIAIALLSFVSALTALQSIGMYQKMITSLQGIEQTVLQKASEGRKYRHMDVDPPYE